MIRGYKPGRVTIALGCLGLLMAIALLGCRATVEVDRPGEPRAVDTDVREEPPVADAAVVTMRDSQYEPAEISVRPGATVTWMNDGRTSHTITSDPGTPAGGPNSDADFQEGIPTGQSYEWRVPDDAVEDTRWYYHCRFHGKPGDGNTRGTGMACFVVLGAEGQPAR
jgi:plastocyanin